MVYFDWKAVKPGADPLLKGLECQGGL